MQKTLHLKQINTKDKNCRFIIAGQWNDMVKATIDLGISILMGGNIAVQKVRK